VHLARLDDEVETVEALVLPNVLTRAEIEIAAVINDQSVNRRGTRRTIRCDRRCAIRP
jgi:hypothetical protein